MLWHSAKSWPVWCQGSFSIDFAGSRPLPKWWLLQRCGARVHLSQGKSALQAKEMNLCDPDLGLLGDAKGRTWNGRKAVQDGFFRK